MLLASLEWYVGILNRHLFLAALLVIGLRRLLSFLPVLKHIRNRVRGRADGFLPLNSAHSNGLSSNVHLVIDFENFRYAVVFDSRSIGALSPNFELSRRAMAGVVVSLVLGLLGFLHAGHPWRSLANELLTNNHIGVDSADCDVTLFGGCLVLD